MGLGKRLCDRSKLENTPTRTRHPAENQIIPASTPNIIPANYPSNRPEHGRVVLLAFSCRTRFQHKLWAALGCSSLLLAAHNCFWLLPAAPGCSWLLLAAPGCTRLLLAAPGCFWLLLAALGCFWLPLAGVAWCLRPKYDMREVNRHRRGKMIEVNDPYQ